MFCRSNWSAGYGRLLFCLLMILAAGSFPVLAQNQPEVIRSASEPGYPPFCIVDENRQADGFAVELLRAALEEMGYAVSFQVGPWDEIRQRLVERQVQVLPLVGRTPEREAWFDFTFPYMSMHGTLVVRADELQINQLEDLRGRQVAVMAGDNAEEFVRRQDLDLTVATRPSFEEALRELSQGQHDAVVMQKLLFVQLSRELGIGNLKTAGPPLRDFVQSFCFAVPRGDAELLSLLNEGLSIVMANGTFHRLRHKWFAPLDDPIERTIIVGGDFNYPPYEFLDAEGQPAGYNVALTRAIAEQLGLKVEFQLGPWEKTREQLANHEIDIIQGMFYSPTRDRSFDFTDPHTLVSHVAVVRDGIDIPQTMADLAGKTIVVMSGDIMHDLAVKAGFTEQLLLTESQEQALRLLAAGQGDCALIARLPALYWIQKNQLNQLRVGDQPFVSLEYSYASHPDGRDLLERFSVALTDLKATGAYRKIHQQWLGVYEPPGIDGWQVAKYSLVIAGPIFLLLAASLGWSQSLKKQVRLRTLTLESEIAERRQAERELQASHARARLILDSAAEAIYGIDRDGNCSFCNQSCLDLLGYASEQELLGRNMHDLIHHTTSAGEPHNVQDCRIYASFMTGEKIHVDDEVLWKADGSWFPAEYWSYPAVKDGEVSGAVVSFIDISERKAAEKEHQNLQNQLHQAQKIESVGRLAGGVAHDYNNMLSVIIGFTELAQIKAAPDDPLQECLTQILNAALRSRDITQQLLAFARKQILAPKVLDINTTVENMLKMLRHLLGENIDLVWLPRNQLWPVKMDPSQLDQLLANLCVNARDAITEVGKMTIETSQASLDQAYCDDHPGFLPGDFVVLSVSDDGCGMDKDILQHIFEPFFTTKGVGTGTGLGLAMVYGVVKQSNGFINVYSEPGHGTTFKVYLPRHHGEVETQHEAVEVENHQGDNQTVLVVEDEPAILSLIETILQGFGYQVLAADSPSTALELAREHGQDIPLLITDVVMPEMNGRQLADRLRALCPRIRTLYMSGYTANAIAHHGVLEKDIYFLHKPFSKQDLSRQIKEILGPER